MIQVFGSLAGGVGNQRRRRQVNELLTRQDAV